MIGDTQTRTIGPVTLTVAELPFTVARSAAIVLAKSIGPLFTSAALATQGRGTIDFSTLDEASFKALDAAFGPSSTAAIDGGDPFPLHNAEALQRAFGGRPATYAAWLAFAVEVNFKDFFEFARGLLGGIALPGATARAGSAQKSPSVSTSPKISTS